MSIHHYALLLAALAPAACTSPPPPADAESPNMSMAGPNRPVTPNQRVPVTETKVEADYIGKWIGPEGLVLEVTAKPGGGVTIANQWTLDDKGSFEGSVTNEGLRWMRGGEAVTAAPSDGDATGLKWLAGKKDCLTVKPGEGYCRD